jgi:RNA polymerase nonessential primary-like sigma factor
LLTGKEDVLPADDGHGGDSNRRVEASIAFVVKAANEYRDLGVPIEDLVNAGNLGLLEAARRFDATRGNKFLTYAKWWVRKALLDTLEQQARVVRLPNYQLKRSREARDAEKELASHLGRKPTREEIAAQLPDRDGTALRRSGLRHREVGLDHPGTAGRDDTLADQLPDRRHLSPEERLIHEQSILKVQEAIEDLTEQQRRIVSDRFGLSGEAELTLKAIGEVLGLSRERVRQIECEALARLRRSLERMKARRSTSRGRCSAHGSSKRPPHLPAREE